MEYYAKSRQKILTQGEIDKVKNELEDLIMNLEGEFTETDLKIIRNNISHLQDTEEEGQKTLKEHQNDIVKCAESFFEEYGEYFTEKEKCLVIEACRMHDWGKANLIFQGLVNSAQVKEQYSDIGRITQIPHGFLSAVTISRNEFKNYQNCSQKKILDHLSQRYIITTIEKTFMREMKSRNMQQNTMQNR